MDMELMSLSPLLQMIFDIKCVLCGILESEKCTKTAANRPSWLKVSGGSKGRQEGPWLPSSGLLPLYSPFELHPSR